MAGELGLLGRRELRRLSRLRRVRVVHVRNGVATELREIGAQRPALARAFGEHLGRARVGGVARAHDLDGGQAAFAVPLDDDHVVPGHAGHDIGAFKLALGGFDARHLPRGRDDGFASAGVAVAPRVFTRDVDVEADVAVMLHAAHIEPAPHQLGDEFFDKGCFS